MLGVFDSIVIDIDEKLLEYTGWAYLTEKVTIQSLVTRRVLKHTSIACLTKEHGYRWQGFSGPFLFKVPITKRQHEFLTIKKNNRVFIEENTEVVIEYV